MNARELVPPALLTAMRRIKGRSGKARYKNYTEALAACSKDGYENQKVVEVVTLKTLRYRNELNQKEIPTSINATNAYSLVGLLLSVGRENQINVLDFGGAAGAHYFLARSILPESRKLNWVVVETPAMAERAGALLESNELHFTADLNEAREWLSHVDMLHTSGTVQCVPDPYEQLQQLINIKADYMLLNRLGLTQGDHDVITIHKSQLSWNGPGPLPAGIRDEEVSYPFTFPQESIFRSMLNKSYKEIAVFKDTSGIFQVAEESIVGMGLIAKRLGH